MADKKISELTAITGADTAADDFFIVVDTSGSATKKISRAELNNAIEQDVLAQVDITSANIDGGTIDNTPIGSTTASTGAFTTVDTTGDVTVGGNLTVQGTTVTIDTATTQTVDLGDNDKIRLGDANDLQIYHDATDSHVVTTSGDLNLQVAGGGTINLGDQFGNTLLKVVDNADVKLYHGTTPSQKLATTSGGISVTGTATISNTNDITIGTLSGAGIDFSKAGVNYILANNASGSLVFTSGGTTSRLNINSIGDISFYDSTGTTQGLFWDASTQNLGVGVTNPATTLHVKGGTNENVMIVDATGTAANYIFDVRDDGTSKFRVDPSGNVGIGTSSPTTGYKLEIENSTGNAQQLITAGTNYNSTISFGDQTASTSGQIVYAHNGDYMRFDTNGSERMRVTSSGSLGLGRSNPNEKLSVSGNIELYNDDQDGYIWFHDAGTRSWTIGSQQSTGNFVLTNAVNVGSGEKFVVTGGGNVGIGTASPNANTKLDVNGAARIGNSTDGIIIENNSGAFGISNAAYIRRNSSTGALELTSGSTTARNMIFNTGTSGAESMRLDSLGNLLVGKTSATTVDQGVVLRNNGEVYATQDGDKCLVLNRKTSDGQIASFRKDNTEVGSIGTNGGRFYIKDNTYGGITFGSGGNSVLPAGTTGAFADNTTDLGSSSARFKDLYLSGGVYLGGTGASNLLDDYEEGTWTPVMEFGGSTAGVTYALQTGSYTKVGRLVTINIAIQLSSNGTGSGAASITGLPFAIADTVSSTSIDYSGSVGYYTGVSGVYGNLSLIGQDSSGELIFRHKASDVGGVATTTTDTQIGNSFELRATMTYFTT